MTLSRIVVIFLFFGATACTIDDTNVRGPGQSYPMASQKVNSYGTPRSVPLYEYPDTAESEVPGQEDTTQGQDVSTLSLDLGSL